MNSAVVGNLKLLLSLDSSNYDKGVTNSEANTKKLADRLSKDLAPSQQRVNALIRDFVGNKDIARALEFATAVEKVGGASKLTASEQSRTNRVVQEAIEKYRALGQEAPKHLTDLANATKQVQKPTEQLGTSMTSLMGKARSLAGVFGVTLGAGALVGFGRSVFNAADEIGDLALKMGVSTDAAQRFQFAARQSGAEIENVSQSIVKMNNNLAEGDKSTVSALKAAGLKFQDIRAMKSEDAFRAIADAIAKIPDPMLQSKVALELFGKAGAELLPMIRENSLKAADGARIMNEQTIKELKDAQQEWENFWNSIIVMTGNAIGRIRRGEFGIFGLAQPLVALFAPEVKKDDLSRLAGFAGTGDAQEVGVGGLFGNFPTSKPGNVKFKTKEEIEAEERAAKERANKIAKIIDDFTSKGTIERISELSAAFAGIDVKDVSLVHLTKLREELDKLAKTGEKLGPVLERMRLTPIDFTNPSAFSRRLSNDMALLQFMAKGSGMQPIDFSESMSGNAINSSVRALFATIPKERGMQPVEFTPFHQRSVFQTQMASLANLFDVPKVTQETFGQSMQGLMAMLPQNLLAAFQGGGNPLKSLGAMFGGGIGQHFAGKSVDGIFKSGFGKTLQGAFGGSFGGALGSAIPGIASMGMSSLMTEGGGKGMLSNIGSFASAGMMFGPWGAAIGAGIGAIVGLFKKGANNTKKAREEFAKQLNFESLDNLYAKLRSIGAEGEKLANTGLNFVGKNDAAGNQKWMKDVTAFFDRLERVPGKVAELSTALGKFGGAIPAQLEPLLDSILGDSNLSADLKKQLEGLRKPSWQAAQELATSFGIDASALGKGFNQSRVADSAFELKRGIDLFSRFEGSDQNAILRDMADEFSGVANEAKKNNVALPKAVEAFIRQIDAMGLLLDENGERIDSSLLQFADIEDEYQKQVVSLLQDIKDLLGGTGAYAPTAEAPSNFNFWRRQGAATGPVTGVPWDGNEGDQNIHMPSFAGGTRGQFMDFGAGTPVMLHGKERVQTASDSAGRGSIFNIYAMDTIGFETFLRQRGGAEAVVRVIPGVVERWGRA